MRYACVYVRAYVRTYVYVRVRYVYTLTQLSIIYGPSYYWLPSNLRICCYALCMHIVSLSMVSVEFAGVKLLHRKAAVGNIIIHKIDDDPYN